MVGLSMLPNLRSGGGGGRSMWVGGAAGGVVSELWEKRLTNEPADEDTGLRLIWVKEARVTAEDLGDGESGMS